MKNPQATLRDQAGGGLIARVQGREELPCRRESGATARGGVACGAGNWGHGLWLAGGGLLLWQVRQKAAHGFDTRVWCLTAAHLPQRAKWHAGIAADACQLAFRQGLQHCLDLLD